MQLILANFDGKRQPDGHKMINHSSVCLPANLGWVNLKQTIQH